MGNSAFTVSGTSTGIGTLTSVTATAPIVATPSPITSTGVISMQHSAVTPGTYVGATVTVDQFGIVQGASGGSTSTVQIVSTQTGAYASGTGTFTQNDTIPTNTNGDQYMSLAITPTNINNTLVIEAWMQWSTSGSTPNFMALFQDSTANALTVSTMLGSTGNLNNAYLKWIMTAGTTSSTTFKIRAGSYTGSGRTFYFNGASGSRVFGGACSSGMLITEYIA